MNYFLSAILVSLLLVIVGSSIQICAKSMHNQEEKGIFTLELTVHVTHRGFVFKQNVKHALVIVIPFYKNPYSTSIMAKFGFLRMKFTNEDGEATFTVAKWISVKERPGMPPSETVTLSISKLYIIVHKAGLGWGYNVIEVSTTDYEIEKEIEL